MKNIIPFLLLTTFIASSCRSVKNLFENKTPHEKYADKLEDKHVDESPEGRQWLMVSTRALEDAQSVELAYVKLVISMPIVHMLWDCSLKETLESG